MGYQRDSAGIIAAIINVPPGGTSGTGMLNVYYRPFGPAYQLSFVNGITNNFTLDQDYRVTGISDNSSIQNLTYVLDHANNVSSITDSLHAANSQSFGYDVIDRLTSATSGTGGYGSLAWTYDKVGNLLTKTVATTTTTYTTPSTSNRLASWLVGGVTTNVTTNADGNITSIPSANGMGTGSFSYNAANRLSGVTGTATAATFVYDGLGHRFSKTQGGSSTYYYSYGLDDALLEENDNGVVTDYIYLDGKPVGVLVPGSSPPTTTQLYYLHDDRLGTPQYATNSSKAVVWSAGGYQPYGTTGTISTSITQNLRLPGQYMDVEAGFYQNGARDYMPNLGRYLEADPFGLAGGMNAYAYTSGNPLKFTDPLGLITTGGLDLNVTTDAQVAGQAATNQMQATRAASEDETTKELEVGAQLLSLLLPMGGEATGLARVFTEASEGMVSASEALERAATVASATKAAATMSGSDITTALLDLLINQGLDKELINELEAIALKTAVTTYEVHELRDKIEEMFPDDKSAAAGKAAAADKEPCPPKD